MKKTLWMASLIAPASVFLMPVRAGAERNNINPPTIWTWVFPLCTVEDEAGNQIEQLEFGKKATFVAESKYALSSSVEWTYRANASSPASQKIWEKRWVSGVVCTADVEIVTAAMAAERGWTDLGVRASALAVNFDGAAAFIVDPPIPVGCCACAKGQCDQPGGTKSTHVSGLQAQMSFGHGGALGLMPNAEFTDVNRAMAIEGLAAICNKIAQKTPEQFPSPEGVAAMEPLPDSRAGQTLRFVPLSEAGLPDANGIYDLSGAVSSNWISMERIGQPLDEDSTAPYAYEIRRASGNLVEREVCVPVPPVSPDPALSAPLRKGAWNVWTYKEEGETSTLLQRTVNTRSLTDTTLTESYTVLDGEGATLHVSELRTTYLPGFQTIQTVTRVRDPGPAGRNETTTTQYYTNPAETNRYGKEYRTVRPDGSWTEYDYDNQGRVSVRQQGLLDAEAGGASSATTYGYTAVDVADDGTFPDRPRTVVRSIDGVEVSRTYTSIHVADNSGANPLILTREERAVVQGAGYGAASNLRTTRWTWGRTDPDAPGVGETQSVLYPDGRLETHVYEFGNYTESSRVFTASTNGLYQRRAVTHGTEGSPSGLARSTLRETTITLRRTEAVYCQETAVYTGSAYETVEWATHQYNETGRRIRTDRSNGTYEEVSPGCCGPIAKVGYDGTVEDFGYDVLGRPVTTSREGAAVGTGAPTNAVETHQTYDGVGRIVMRRTVAGSLALTNRTVYDAANRVSMTIDEQGRTNSYGYSSDALTESATNSSGLITLSVRYRDGRPKYTEIGGARRLTYAYGVETDGRQWTTVYTGPAGSSSPVWEKTWTDLLGRTVRRERPAFGGSTLAETSVYDTVGHLTTTTATGKPSTLYAYNDLGERIRTALDLDEDGTMDLSGPDRVTGSLSGYVSDGSGHWWRHSTSTVYAAESGDTPTVVSVQRERLSGLGSSGARGLLTDETVSLDIRGNSTTSQSWTDRSAKRLTRLDTIPGSANTAVQVAVNGLTVTNISATAVTVTVAYDALGRQAETRTVSDGGARSVASVTAYDILGRVASVADAANNTTRLAYDVAGRQIAATNALGQVVQTAYDPEDRVIATWGATYPVAYEFDAFGRMVAMATTRDPAQESVNLLTLLPPGGSLSQSSVAALDVTRWLYDQPTGLLTNKVYADGKGPSYTYTADGKLARRTWARGATTDYSYETGGALTGIDYSGATPDATFSYDRLGRQVRISDGTGGRTNVYDASTLDLIEERLPDGSVLARSLDSFGRASGIALGAAYDVNYGFDTSGRFGALTSTVGSVQSAFAYSYVPDSDLLAGWGVGGGISFRRTYEPSRDLIATVTNTWNGTALGTFGYENDSLARRTKRIDSGSITNDFGYNLRSEVAAAMMGTNQFGYRYDPIGNRIASTNNSEAFSYAANWLNQYTNIVDGGTVVPSYDDDGNMTGFGTWTYTWDGENRLAIATDGSTAVTNGYDSMSRRVAKGTASETRRFAYDAWNPVRETVDDGGTLSTNFYVWGLDLSQTPQGAGGVGGLLSVVRGDAPYFAGYDANGNVTDYVSANGATVAHYEFDPFGNTTAATGSMADAFAHRFSTKYWDSETELYYYGHRFYSAEIGRWTSRDPVVENGGLNVFVAMGNAPIGGTDNLGLQLNEPPRSVSVFCCGAPSRVFDPKSHCCCKKGTVVSSDLSSDCGLVDRKEIASGIVKHKASGMGSPDAPRQIHYWLEWTGYGSDGSAEANAPSSQGRIASPAVYRFSDLGQEPVELSPCEYDFTELHKCLTLEAKNRIGPCGGLLCEPFIDQLVKKCKAASESRGCTAESK